MRLIAYFIVTLSFVANCAYTLHQYHGIERKDAIVVSERVGETVDSLERVQFDLFSGVDSFESARFYEIDGDGYDVEIFAGHQKFVAYNRDPDALPILREYIERYEVIKDSTFTFEKKWGIVDYDTLGQPITRREIEMNMPPKRNWRAGLALAGATAGCLGSCLVFGAPSLHVDVPTNYDNSEDIEKSLILLGGTTLGGVSGWLVGREFDRRDALKMIKEARQLRAIEF